MQLLHFTVQSVTAYLRSWVMETFLTDAHMLVMEQNIQDTIKSARVGVWLTTLTSAEQLMHSGM